MCYSNDQCINLVYVLSFFTNFVFFCFFLEVFQANANDMMVTTVVLNPLVVAQYIRLHPTNCSNYCTLRMELYGCNSTAGTCTCTVLLTNCQQATSNIYSGTLSIRPPSGHEILVR